MYIDACCNKRRYSNNDSFVLKALRGKFEEQDVVQLFIQSGKDSFGFPLYFPVAWNNANRESLFPGV